MVSSFDLWSNELQIALFQIWVRELWRAPKLWLTACRKILSSTKRPTCWGNFFAYSAAPRVPLQQFLSALRVHRPTIDYRLTRNKRESAFFRIRVLLVSCPNLALFLQCQRERQCPWECWDRCRIEHMCLSQLETLWTQPRSLGCKYMYNLWTLSLEKISYYEDGNTKSPMEQFRGLEE